jgi:hypothetical protein
MATIKFRRGTSYPNGLTAGEPAFRTDTDQFYIHDGVTAVWVGALISTGDLSTGSTLTVPTQSAVKTYVDANIAGGAVTSVSGVTGAVLLGAGTGITLSTASKTITITNTGVHSFNGSTGAVSFSNYVASAVAGSNITVSSATGNVTIGVTPNPSFTTLTTTGTGSIGGNLTVTGNLIVNGTTTTVNSDVMTVDDPIIVIGLSGGLPLTVSDGSKDRGVAFNYHSGGGLTGFFGFDASIPEFVAIGKVSISSEVVTPDNTSWLDIHGKDIILQDVQSDSAQYYGKLTVDNQLAANRTYTLPNWSGEVVVPSTNGTTDYILKSTGSASQPTWINPNSSGFTAFAATQLATARNIALTGNVTATGVAFDGTAGITLTTTIGTGVVTNAMLVNSGFTLGSTNITLGSTTTTLAGLSSVTATTFTGSLSGTATTATNVTLTEATSSNTSDLYPTFIASGATGGLLIDATAQSGLVALSYRPSTGVLTAYKVEAIVDGGSY